VTIAALASSCAYYNTFYLARRYYFKATSGEPYEVDRTAAAQTPNYTDSVVLADAVFYEAAALGQFTDNAYVYINWSGGLSPQDGTPAQMLEGPLYFDNGPTPVAPEPATLVLVGAALIGIGWNWRRRILRRRCCILAGRVSM